MNNYAVKEGVTIVEAEATLGWVDLKFKLLLAKVWELEY